jgi:hypothetical protein
VYGPHVLHGGFYLDDWSSYVRYTQDSGPSLLDKIDSFVDLTSYRPVLAVYVPLTIAMFGRNSHLFLAWGTVLACVMSASFFLLLRTVGMQRLHAGAIAVLLLIYPASDSVRLWGTSAHPSLAVATCFLGMTVALRGFQYRGRRAVLMHAGAIALYLLSMWNHELIIPGVVFAVLLYRLRAPWSAALRRWPFDLVVVGLTLLFITSAGTNPNKPQPLISMVGHAWDIGVQTFAVIAASMAPWLPPNVALIAVPVAIGVLGAFVVRAFSARDPARAALSQWLLVAMAGLLATVLAYSLFIPAAATNNFEPLALGTAKRTNLLAGAGIVTLVYAVLQIAAIVVFKGGAAWRARATAGALALTVLLGGGYAYRIEDDAAAWNRAADIQQDVLTEVHRLRPRLPSGETVFLGGYSPYSAPNIPSLAYYFDTTSALRVRLGGMLSAFPILGTAKPGETCLRATLSRGALARCASVTQFNCEHGSIVALTPNGSPYLHTRIRYGSLMFISVDAQTVLEPRNARECAAAVRATPGGPIYESLRPFWPAPSLDWAN